MAVAGLGFIVFACVAHSRHDREFVDSRLLPLARFVVGFREAQGRLPTGVEFNDWAVKADDKVRVEYYPKKPDFVSEWGTPGRDFIVGAWRGEWMHYYQSWNGKDFAGEMAPVSEPSGPHR